MIIMYIMLIAYILAINFYAFLLVKSLRDKERQEELEKQTIPLSYSVANETAPEQKKTEKGTGKLFITAALGGAITIYVCMFILKYRRADLLLMIAMPLLGVLNVYLWVLLFRSGFSFLMIR
ncbi:MAG: hypothetical protein IKA20_01600 [Clostridia bacterium]|nr:hypothetical protein [Clostridia bacterium]